MKFKRSRIKNFSLASLIISSLCTILLACGDDADSGIGNEKNVSEVETKYEVGACTNEREGASVFVTTENAYYICTSGTWTKVNNEGNGSSHGNTSISSSSNTTYSAPYNPISYAIVSSNENFISANSSNSSGIFSSSSLFLGHGLSNECRGKVSWHGPSKMHHVNTGIFDETGEFGDWWYFDDYISTITFPFSLVNQIFISDSIIDYCGGICGSVTFNAYSSSYPTTVGIGFSVAMDGASTADVFDWGGFCVTYVSDMDFFLKLRNGDYYTDRLEPLYVLPKTDTPITKKISWNAFEYSGVSGQNFAKSLTMIKFQFELNQGPATTGNFNIISVGSYY